MTHCGTGVCVRVPLGISPSKIADTAYGVGGASPTLIASNPGIALTKIIENEDEKMLEENVEEKIEKGELTVRFLTPRECWRLMDFCPIQADGTFDDTAYEKAKEVTSESQLYKQAGNSIVVSVLDAIFEEMLFPKAIQTTLGGFR